MTPKKAKRAQSRNRVQRYRKSHRRIDYVPIPNVLAIINKHRAAELDTTLAGTIDRLILAGDEAISGNGAGPRSAG